MRCGVGDIHLEAQRRVFVIAGGSITHKGGQECLRVDERCKRLVLVCNL